MKIQDIAALAPDQAAKIARLNNPKVERIVAEFAALCAPAKITVITDAPEDLALVRRLAIEKGEERPLAMAGHTVHFDGVNDQGRDKEVTRVLLEPGETLSSAINVGARDACLEEIYGLARGIMAGREMFVCFLCLGPVGSPFAIGCLQLTDSAYVAHSEQILYRQGYRQFLDMEDRDDFFHFVHSAGELDARGCSADPANKRIYIDLARERVISVNTQYAGNTVGLKKLALRLAVRRACRADWLAEHMFVMAVHKPGGGRTTWFTGAYPSACGKTSTAMVPGMNIMGDDIAYLRAGEDGLARAVNIEQGIFGIIADVNPDDDPLIHKTLTTPRELIFSNVLVADGKPYWLGMGSQIPPSGENFTGAWEKDRPGADGKPVPPAHKNARYTIRLSDLENAHPALHDPAGVPVRAVIYGGRDSDTSVPVYETIDHEHGVFVGACLESETTAATLGAEGVRQVNPMANVDFLTVPLEAYIGSHLRFFDRLAKRPRFFATNYFLAENGKFLSGKVDKKVWLLWMEGRVHGEYGSLETPVGMIPKYEDLAALFRTVFDRDYPRELYDRQFAIRTERWLAKLDRCEAYYRAEGVAEPRFLNWFGRLRQRLRG